MASLKIKGTGSTNQKPDPMTNYNKVEAVRITTRRGVPNDHPRDRLLVPPPQALAPAKHERRGEASTNSRKATSTSSTKRPRHSSRSPSNVTLPETDILPVALEHHDKQSTPTTPRQQESA